MAPLPSLTAVANLKEVLGEVDDDELVEDALSRAVAEFESNIPRESYVKWEGTLKRIEAVYGRFDSDGNLVNKDGGPLLLLAQDDGLNVRGLQWRCHVRIPQSVIPPAPSAMMRSFWFNATGDGTTVDLNDQAPAVASPIQPVENRGPVGPSVDDFTVDEDGNLQFFVDGTPIGAAQPLPSAAWGNIANKPAVVGAGATQAEARAAISAAAVFMADDSTTTSQVNSWLASPVPGGGPHRLQGALTINAPLIIRSNTVLDATRASVTQAPGTSGVMLQNANATTPQRSVTDVATTSGSATVTSATANFGTADIGRTLVVSGAGVNGNGPLVGIIVSRTSTTATLDTKATATLTGRSGKVFDRDSGFKVKGGAWYRGSNGGAGSGLHSMLFRHCDDFEVDVDYFESQVGGGTTSKYAISVGNVRRYRVALRNVKHCSDGIHVTGPAYDGVIPYCGGLTEDNMVALTAADYPEYSDVAGDIIGVTIGDIAAKSAKGLFRIVAGNGLRVDDVKVGTIRGTSTINAVEIIDDPQIAEQNGHVGTVDFGTIDVIVPAGCVDLFLGSVDMDAITAQVIHRADSTAATVSVLVGSGNVGANTIKSLTLKDCRWDGTALVNGVSVTNPGLTLGTLNIVRPVFASSGCVVALGAGAVDDVIVDKGKWAITTANFGAVVLTGANPRSVEVIDCVGDYTSSSTNYVVLQQAGTVTTKVTVCRGRHTGSNAAFRNIPATLFNGTLVLDGCTVASGSRAATIIGAATVVLNNPLFDTLVSAAFFLTTGPFLIKGDIRTNGTFSLIQRAAAEAVRVIGPTLQVDVALLTPSTGDICYNTLGASSPGGTGVVVYEGVFTSTWVTLSKPTIQPVNAQTGTAYTLVLADTGKLVTFNNAAAVTATFPNYPGLPYCGFVDLANIGAGTVTLTGPGTFIGTTTLTTGQRARAHQIAANTWLVR